MKPAFFFWYLTLAVFAETQLQEEKVLRGVRIVKSEEFQKLETAVLSFKKGEKSLSVYGAIHIADFDYYEALNKSFKEYDVVLFEMIGGENVRNISSSQEDSAISATYKMMSTLTKLQGQKEGINYLAKNFVHADLTHAEFHKLNEQYGETLMGYALSKAGVFDEVDPSLMLHAMLSGDADQLKRQMIQPLAEAATLNDEAETVIIHERNNKALSVLKTVLQKESDSKIALFYGAAHLSDFAKKLKSKGWSLEKVDWLTAWKVSDKD